MVLPTQCNGSKYTYGKAHNLQRKLVSVTTEDDLIVESFFDEQPSDKETFENDNIEVERNFKIDDLLEINLDIEE